MVPVFWAMLATARARARVSERVGRYSLYVGIRVVLEIVLLSPSLCPDAL